MDKQFFFIIGAQRCGTTWLYHLLDEHPEIAMAKPLRPEPKFFLKPKMQHFDPDEYRGQYFPLVQQEKMLGEKSTSYIENPVALSNIKSCIDEPKILIILRNPVFRAISNYFFTQSHGLETRSIEEVFIHPKPAPDFKRKVSVNPFDYFKRGLYLAYLKNVFNIFDPHEVRILIYEKLVADYTLIKKEYRWLGVSPDFTPQSASVIYNQNTPSLDPEDEALTAVIQKLSTDYIPYNARLAAYLNIPLREWSISGDVKENLF